MKYTITSYKKQENRADSVSARLLVDKNKFIEQALRQLGLSLQSETTNPAPNSPFDKVHLRKAIALADQIGLESNIPNMAYILGKCHNTILYLFINKYPPDNN